MKGKVKQRGRKQEKQEGKGKKEGKERIRK